MKLNDIELKVIEDSLLTRRIQLNKMLERPTSYRLDDEKINSHKKELGVINKLLKDIYY